MAHPLPKTCLWTLFVCALALSACGPNMKQAAIPWQPLRSLNTCPLEARARVITQTAPHCVNRTKDGKKPCEHIDTIARLWDEKVHQTFEEFGCPNARSDQDHLPTLTISLEEVVFEGGHSNTTMGWLFAAFIIPGYVYLFVDQERAFTARVYATLKSPQGALLWEATLYQQERSQENIGSSWNLVESPQKHKPLFNPSISNALSKLLQKTISTTGQLNASLRTGPPQ